MPAYFMVVGRITDRELLNQYSQEAGPTIKGFNLKLVAATEEAEIVEGQPPGTRVVILEFPDMDEAKRWYNSPAYQAVVKKRIDATDGFGLFVQGV